jgi:hypothetical protein
MSNVRARIPGVKQKDQCIQEADASRKATIYLWFFFICPPSSLLPATESAPKQQIVIVAIVNNSVPLGMMWMIMNQETKE